MDPLSITASTITLIDAATSVYRFLASVRDADSNYSALCLELRDLTDFLRSIDQTYEACCRNPLSVVAVDEEVWRQGRIALRDCQQTLDELNSLVTHIKTPARSNTILRRARLGTQLRRHERKIVTFREKIRMSNRSLQTLLGVVNVSLSLQHNVSQEKALQELQKLNRYLEESQRAASDPSATSFLGDTDKHLVDNLRELIHAAESFHSVASDAASSICSEKALGEPAWATGNYPASVVPARMSSIKMRRIEMLLEGNQGSTRSSSPAPLGSPTPLQEIELDRPFELHQDRLELAHERLSTKTFEAGFDTLFSRGLTKMAQKAIRKSNFADAQEIIQQALKHHQPTGTGDLQHRRLRIQLAACKFFRGDGTKAEDLVIRMAESTTEISPVLISQLLYALALAQIHDLDFSSTKRTCQRIWQALQTCNFSVRTPGENELWGLLAVSFRESGSKLHAEAIEEELPELKLDVLPPTATSVLLDSEEFLTELFDVQDTVDIPWALVNQLRHNEACLEFSALQRRRMQKPECNRDEIIHDPRVKTLMKSASEPEMHGALNLSGTSFQGHQQSLQHILSTRNTTRLRKAPPSISSSLSEVTAPFARFRNTVRRLSGRRPRHTTSISDSISQDGLRPGPTSVFAKFRARFLISNPELGISDLTEDNSGRIVQWLRGQDIVHRQSTTLSDDSSYTGESNIGTTGSVRPRFSFEGTPETPAVEDASLSRRTEESPVYELPGSETRWELEVPLCNRQPYRNPSIIRGGREDQFQTRRIDHSTSRDQPSNHQNKNKLYKLGNNDSGYYSDPERRNGNGASSNNSVPEGKAENGSGIERVRISRWKTARTWLLRHSGRKAKRRKSSSRTLARKTSVAKLPAHGYEYYGPEAVPGPYTVEEGTSDEEFNSTDRCLPEQLQRIEDPKAPLEIDNHLTTDRIEPDNAECLNLVEGSEVTGELDMPCELEASFPDLLPGLGRTGFTPAVYSDSMAIESNDNMTEKSQSSASTEEFRRRIQGIFRNTTPLLMDEGEIEKDDEPGSPATLQSYRQPYCQDEQDEDADWTRQSGTAMSI